MISNLEFYSAKTYHQSYTPGHPIQGTGTIIASQGKHFLVTALHCMRLTDDNGIEILSPDWKKMSACIYMPEGETELEFKGLVDVDYDEDWAILEIEKPANGFDYQHGLILSTSYKFDEIFGAYGFPHHIEDGMYLEFLPTNRRGVNWRLKDMVQGGSTRAITAEKGCSGMGLFHMVDGVYYCLGIINKSVPGGDFNAMSLVSVKSMAKYFPDIYQSLDVQSNKPSDEDLEKQIQAQSKIEYLENRERELAEAFLIHMELVEYSKAYEAIVQLWECNPNDEWATLNMIKVTSLVAPQKLANLREIGLKLNYSTPQGVILVARAFANNGYPQVAVDIWYNNALKFNDNELDTIFYIELLESSMKEIVYKEYETVAEGKSVLYDDGQKHRHCLLASEKTLMSSAMLGKKKGEEFVLNIAGDDRRIKIIAIYDKYYTLVHRALSDVMEQGGNRIMRPIKINENMTPEEVIKTIFDVAGIDPNINIDIKLQNDYTAQPAMILNVDSDDLLWRYYRFLLTDFKLTPWPDSHKDPERFRYINTDTRFVLDLSSLILLFEKTMSGVYVPSRKFIVSNFLYEYIREYQKRAQWHISYDIHKVIEAGKIYRFSDDGLEDIKLRYEALLKWMDDYCERLSSQKVLEMNEIENQTKSSLLFIHTMALLMDNPSRALLTEDWYILELVQEKLFMFSIDEFLML